MKANSQPFYFDNPFRPNYELWNSAMWTAGTGGCYILNFFDHLPAEPLSVVSAAAVCSLAYSLPGGIRLYKRKKNLVSRNLEFITFDELLKKNSCRMDSMWIGYGFEWEHRHAQLSYQLACLDQSNFRLHENRFVLCCKKILNIKSVPVMIGQPWIHGLETREQALYQELRHAEGHTLIVGTTGAGKSQPFSARVMTPYGWVKMGNLRKGDSVLDPFGTVRTVLGIYPQGSQKVYKITLRNGKSAESSVDHLWSVRAGENFSDCCHENLKLKIHNNSTVNLVSLELKEIICLIEKNVPVFVPCLDERLFDKGIFRIEFSEIESVSFERFEGCRCILVDSEEHLYLTDDLIITHNTRLFDILISEAVARNETVVIIDPKGDKELADNARRACVYLRQPERFLYFNPAFPEKSFCIDPLHNFSRATEIASRISALMPSESGSGSTFKAFSWQALNNIIQGLVICRRRPQLTTIKHYLESGAAGLVVKTLESYLDIAVPGGAEKYHNFLQRIEKQRMDQKAQSWKNFYRDELSAKYPNSVIEGLLSMYEHDMTHFSKMVAGLLPILNMLTSGVLGSMLSPNPADREDRRLMLDTAKIINSRSVAYFGLDSLTDGMVGSAIGSLILSDLTAVAGDRYNYGVDNQPVNVFVDEAAEVINQPFIQLLNKGRGAKLRLFVATQTFADFAARLGSADKATQVLGNINNIFALRVTDVETQTYITDKIPKTRIKTITHTQGQNSDAEQPIVHSGSQAQMLKEEEVDLFPPALLGQLPTLEYIANISGGKIIKGRIPILTERK